MKEGAVGLINSLAVAATTSLGVFVWSRSVGLAGVIALSMVVSMFVVVGFFSFLGIATLLMSTL